MSITDLQLPSSREEISDIQNKNRSIAFEKAKRAKYYKGKLSKINEKYLDQPEEWSKIPVIDKEILREIGSENFEEQFCISPREEIAEYWRSGGATGVPLYYPRTYIDMFYTQLQLCRCWSISGAEKGDLCHMSFPLGVHPAGQLWSRTANQCGVGIIWAGSGTGTPSQTQLDLILSLKPTTWMGMPSFGLHLANLADNRGVDLTKGSVKKILVGAEPLSKAKRDKLERTWGAKVNDLFGMTEIGILGADSHYHEGFHVWTDQAIFEVIDEKTLEPMEPGEEGLMVITPLFTNNCTPFLRWSSGDIVSMHQQSSLEGPFSIFPLMRHAHRTSGFFKIKGININHSEFEDFMFDIPEINDFKTELINKGGLDIFRVEVEVHTKFDGKVVTKTLKKNIQDTFEVRPEVKVLKNGVIAKEFEATVKPPRFLDRR